MRSLTTGSSSMEKPDFFEPLRRKRRSQVFDMSPSSSENEDARSGNALLRVQRRRQDSRRASSIVGTTDPYFRPLDVLVCEEHPIARTALDIVLQRLMCRVVTVDNGAEAMRCSMGEIKFDIILMDVKLPQVSGADVARMIRNTRNVNRSTPIVAVTSYLVDMSDPQLFDALIMKPLTREKLVDQMGRLCNWTPPPDEKSKRLAERGSSW